MAKAADEPQGAAQLEASQQLEDADELPLKLIVGFSLVAGMVGLVPLAAVSETGIGILRTLLVIQLARRRDLGLKQAMASRLGGCWDQHAPARAAAAAGALASKELGWKRLTLALKALLRFDEISRTFLLGLYIERHLLRRPEGKPLDEREVEQLRSAIIAATTSARRHLISALFSKTVRDLLRAGTFVPRSLWKLTLAALEQHDGEALKQVVEEDAEGFISRVSQRLQQELASTRDTTITALWSAFDEQWEATTQKDNSTAPQERDLPR